MAASTIPVRQQEAQTLKGQKQNKRALRNVLVSPYILPWPQLNEGSGKGILKKLRTTFSSIDLKKQKMPYFRGKDKQIKKKEFLQKRDVEDNPKIKNLRNQLVIGLNNVMRSLERDTLRLVLVNHDTRPPVPDLTRHLITIAAVRKCPLLPVRSLTTTLAPLLGLSSLITLGFKKMSDGDEDDFSNLIDFLVERVVPLDIPWLQEDVSSPSVPKAENSKVNSDSRTENTSLMLRQSAMETEQVSLSSSETSQTNPGIDTEKNTPTAQPQKSVREPNLPPINFDAIYVKKSDSQLIDGKVKPADFGSEAFLAFDVSSDDDQVVRRGQNQSEKATKKRGFKRKASGDKSPYEPARIGKIKSNQNRVSGKLKKKKKN